MATLSTCIEKGTHKAFNCATMKGKPTSFL